MDKAELIRHEIEKRKDHNLAIGNPLFAAMAEEDIELLSFIDSMQEEPIAPKVLEDMLNAKTAAESLGISQEEHNRIVDELIYGKEPELVDFNDMPLDPNIQYASREIGIKAHAEDYSFNIESELFQQLNKEQQELWRKEIEQACMSGGYCGLNLGLDKRYDKEEPVSEDLNIESMIKSYEQRLISQANGVKNSPLVDMCLASYKHGINETLDTLKLSNIQRIVKNRKESKFKVGDRIKFKGVRNEDVTRVITNIQKSDGGGFRYLFADGSIYSIDDDGIELVEEPVNEELEEEIKTCFLNNTCKVSETSVCSFAAFGRIARHFAEWQKEKMMAKAIDGTVRPDDNEIWCNLASSNFEDGDKAKIIVIKED